jgi:hypothetical protein
MIRGERITSNVLRESLPQIRGIADVETVIRR